MKGYILKKTIEIISATAMLLSIAKADEVIENYEIESIHNIVSDFFQIDSKEEVDNFINLIIKIGKIL